MAPRSLRRHAHRARTTPTVLRRVPQLEPLESRHMLAADLRSFDGIGNNLNHAEWGSAGANFLRTAAAEYADGISTPAGENRANPRAISNALVAQPEDAPTNEREMSAFIYAWGQFIDHDMDLLMGGTESFNVPVPTGDPMFDPESTGTKVIPLTRAAAAPGTGTDPNNPREQVNLITAFLDGSMVYGSDKARSDALRTFEGGTLKTGEGNVLPFNTMGLANDNPMGRPAASLFVAGDVRSNENGELSSLHALFMREHNRLAAQYARLHPNWTDEQIFQQAREIVIAEIQVITYNEFLPALLGSGAVDRYRGYNARVNPGISNEFATAGFRIGHTMVGSDIEFLDDNGEEVAEELLLRDNFFNPAAVLEHGIDPILKYLASDRAQEVDNTIVDELRNFLFNQPGQGGLDLASINVQRGRDHGLADYNATRVAYGLKPVTRFSQITSDTAVQAALAEMYGDVNNIDLWVGGLAEDHQRASSVGPLFTRIIADQFERLRDGDRFWYQRSLSASEVRQVERTTLSSLIERNTDLANLQDNVFFFHATVKGNVFADINGDGRRGFRELQVIGIAVQLLDAEGAVIATTSSNWRGDYSFTGLDMGSYTVRLALPAYMEAMAPEPVTVTFTRGDEYSVNLGIDLSWLWRQNSAAEAEPLAGVGDPLQNASTVT